MWLWALAYAGLSHVRLHVHDTPASVRHTAVSVRFQAWCLTASTYLQEQLGAFSAEHDDAARALYDTQQELNGIEAKLAAVRRAALPQSSDGGAGLAAAMDAMATAFSPEQQALEGEDRAARQALNDAQALFDDSAVLRRRIGDVLGTVAKATRLEQDLDAEVQRVLSPFVLALLHRRWSQGAGTPIEATLKALTLRKEHLQARVVECTHLAADREAVAASQAAAAETVAQATAHQVVRMDATLARQATLNDLGQTVANLQAEQEAVFTMELAAYSQEADAVGSDAAKVKAIDTAHSFWKGWREEFKEGFSALLTFVGTRHKQLGSVGETQQYLRADKSPHLAFEKELGPEGFCPPAEAMQQRMDEVDAAIAQIHDLA